MNISNWNTLFYVILVSLICLQVGTQNIGEHLNLKKNIFKVGFLQTKLHWGWSNWDRSNLDKIDLIGQRSYAIDIQAALTAEPPPINLEQN